MNRIPISVQFSHAGHLFYGVEKIEINIRNLVPRKVVLTNEKLEDTIQLEEKSVFCCDFYSNGAPKGTIMIVPMPGRKVTVYNGAFTINIEPVALIDPRTEAPAHPSQAQS